MSEIIITIIFTAIEAAITDAVKDGINYIIRKITDSSGNVSVKILYEYDTDGDGVNDAEETIYTLDTLIPSLDNGYTLCNKDNEVGLGLPQYKVVDCFDIVNYIDDDIITGNDNGFIVDFDGDGDRDDILVPLPDFSGDGYSDWGWLVDDDDNGLPDVSPYSPFYPVGSEEYHEIVCEMSDDYTIMDKPISKYTVTEGLLLLFAIVGGFKLLGKAFRRKKVV